MAALPFALRGDENSTDSTNLPSETILSEEGGTTYLLRFHTGQEVMDGLLAFAAKHNLVSGHLTGIGAISRATIGYFDPVRKEYLRTNHDEQMELVSIIGNLALVAGKPFYHIHVGLGMRDSSARGGHLFQCIVRPTVELVLTAYSKPVRRQLDSQTGLQLLDL